MRYFYETIKSIMNSSDASKIYNILYYIEIYTYVEKLEAYNKGFNFYSMIKVTSFIV